MESASEPGPGRPAPVIGRLFIIFVFSFSLTVLWQGMRELQLLGGYAATGGPYLITKPAPERVWVMYVAIPLVIVSMGAGFARLRRKDGPDLMFLAWPACCVSLGWNFLESGLGGLGNSGPEWTDLAAAALFILLGLIPLAVLVLDRRRKRKEQQRLREPAPPRMPLAPLLPQLVAAGLAVALGVLFFRGLR